MVIATFIERIRQQPEAVAFKDVIAFIDSHYDYQPSCFTNGVGAGQLVNEAGKNEGSCKIFAFAQLNGLDVAETLACFGDYYRVDVLNHPQGSDHSNIRLFMRYGWQGVTFERLPLTVKKGLVPGEGG